MAGLLDFVYHNTLVASLILATGSVGSYILYRLALPKPFAGIPYNAASAGKVLGDVPAMLSHIKQTDGNLITYSLQTMKSLNAPLVQIFLKPLGKPILVLADFRETQDLLHRKDFDRSSNMGDLIRALVPEHHITLKTGAKFKTQRRLIQDLMTPTFLHNIAAPVIYENAESLLELFRLKGRAANGQPWKAGEDVLNAALDAVMSFVFGDRFQESATAAAVASVESEIAKKSIKTSKNADEAVDFSTPRIPESLQAIYDLGEVVQVMQGSPVPRLTREYIMRRSHIKRALKIKDDYFSQEMKIAVERLQEGQIEKSAVHHVMLREKSIAEKEGRQPDYFSRVILDETFGFIFAGHETTGTAICWGLKLLASNLSSQAVLRNALQASFSAAYAAKRNPTIDEITSTNIPYLDAWIEEVQRCGGTAPLVDREALVDTQLLGYPIPKGTVVACLSTGPSMLTPGFDIDESRRSNTTSQAFKTGRENLAWAAEDIGAFKPERWLVNGEFDASAGPQLAFGLGVRGCYGKRLGYLTQRILFTLIVWNFELLPCPEKLSGNKTVIVSTNKPIDCYVRLCEVDLSKG